jgi:predicted dehydrogenase
MTQDRFTLPRRDFLKLTGAAAAAGLTFSMPRPARARLDAGEKIVVAVIGCGGMGNHHLSNLRKRQDVEIAAVCDVYTPRYEEAAASVGGGCKGYQDFRRILDRQDIDAVWIATPDHWHAMIAILACQAGKDVYVEKPLTTTVTEGRKIVEAARRYGSVVQVGIQQRSMEVYQKAIEIAKAGTLGQINTTRAWINPNYATGPEQPAPVPKGLDWDLWLGPAPWVPYSPQRFYSFRQFDDYAGGELTNWGPHLVDIALWAMGEDRPLTVQALGNTYRQLTCSDPETIEVIFEFPGATMTWSQAFNEQHAGKSYGTMFQGTEGRLIIDRQSFVVEPESRGIEPYYQPGEYFITVENHHDNFLECVRSRRRPRADVEIGHRATSACLLANIAIDCQRRLEWDGDAERFIGDEQANRHLYRPYRAPWHV